MITNPETATQLAREHQRELQAQAGRCRPGRPAPRTTNPAASTIRRLAMAMARADQTAARA